MDINILFKQFMQDPDFASAFNEPLEEAYSETDLQGQILQRGDLSGYKISDKELEKVKSREMIINENTITGALPPSIDKFLMDMSQMYIDDISYNDISNFGNRATEEDIKQLRKYKRELSQGFEEDDPEVQEIFKSIKSIVKGLNENMVSKFDKMILNESLFENIIEDGEEVFPYEFVAVKTVYDSNGFTDEYHWYRDRSTDKHYFYFGEPMVGYEDWECDSFKEAQEWFDNYKGFEDEEELNEALHGMKEINEFFQLCKEIGLETLGDLERFAEDNKNRVIVNNALSKLGLTISSDAFFETLRDYRNEELPDDFKIGGTEFKYDDPLHVIKNRGMNESKEILDKMYIGIWDDAKEDFIEFKEFNSFGDALKFASEYDYSDIKSGVVKFDTNSLFTKGFAGEFDIIDGDTDLDEMQRLMPIEEELKDKDVIINESSWAENSYAWGKARQPKIDTIFEAGLWEEFEDAVLEASDIVVGIHTDIYHIQNNAARTEPPYITDADIKEAKKIIFRLCDEYYEKAIAENKIEDEIYNGYVVRKSDTSDNYFVYDNNGHVEDDAHKGQGYPTKEEAIERANSLEKGIAKEYKIEENFDTKKAIWPHELAKELRKRKKMGRSMLEIPNAGNVLVGNAIFNMAMGSDGGSSVGCSEGGLSIGGGTGVSESLEEEKNNHLDKCHVMKVVAEYRAKHNLPEPTDKEIDELISILEPNGNDDNKQVLNEIAVVNEDDDGKIINTIQQCQKNPIDPTQSPAGKKAEINNVEDEKEKLEEGAMSDLDLEMKENPNLVQDIKKEISEIKSYLYFLRTQAPREIN